MAIGFDFLNMIGLEDEGPKVKKTGSISGCFKICMKSSIWSLYVPRKN